MKDEAVDRMRLVFSLLDADRNGYIDVKDFDLMSSRVVQAAPDSTDAEKQALVTALRRMWEMFADLDANLDGRITLQEWTDGALDPAFFSEVVRELADSYTRLGDPEGDGLVSRTRFMNLTLALGHERENIDKLFDALADVGADHVRRQDWADEIVDFHDPSKAGIAGDHLVSGA